MINYRMSRCLPPCAFLLAMAAASLHAQQIPEIPDDPETAATAAVEAARPKLPMELPPNEPTVSCKDGQLTINAENSTMASVLSAVHGCIGAAIVIPDGSSGTRMYAKLGPGPANEILQSLLGDTDFDYVIEPSPTNPKAIKTVLLMARNKDSKDQTVATSDRAMTPQRRAWLDARRNARPYDEIEGESRSAVEPEAEPVVEPVVAPVTAVPDPATQPAAAKAVDPAATDAAQQAAKAAGTPATGAPTPDTTTPAPATNDAVNTPPPDPASDQPAAKQVQEKITTMQQLFEQRKQLQQSQTAPATNPQ